MISKKRRDRILMARSDEGLAMIRKLIRERTSDEWENRCNLTASRGRFTITFPLDEKHKIIRTFRRAELLEFVDGLEKPSV